MSDKNQKTNVGYTLYKPTGLKHKYSHVDLVNQRVICIVTYKGKTYMTVTVDVKNDSVNVLGDVKELGDLSMDRDSYIEMFKHQAMFFIDNNISDPEKYYETLIDG